MLYSWAFGCTGSASEGYIWIKKNPEVLKKQNGICYVFATIYIAFTLY